MKNLTSYLLATALLTSPAFLVQAAEQQPADGQQAERAQQDQQDTLNTLNTTQATPAPTESAPTEEEGSDQSEGTNNSNESTDQTLEQTSTTASGQKFIEEISEQEILASDLMGYSVTNLQNENIGKVEDLILDQNDQPAGIVISAGGFLGLGAKHVAIPMSEARINRENKIVQVNIDKEELNTAPAFKTQKAAPNGQTEDGSGDANGQ